MLVEIVVNVPQELLHELRGEMSWLLEDTCSFPVDKRNWLVAASGMVSMQLELSFLEDAGFPTQRGQVSGTHSLGAFLSLIDLLPRI